MNIKSFSRCFKDTLKAVAVVLVIRFITKMLFERTKRIDFFNLYNEFIKSDSKMLIVLYSVVVLIFIWLVSSLILGTIYYIYLKIKSNLNIEDHPS